MERHVHSAQAQSLSRHKKLHSDLTKPHEICKKGIRCELTIIRDIQLRPKKPCCGIHCMFYGTHCMGGHVTIRGFFYDVTVMYS